MNGMLWLIAIGVAVGAIAMGISLLPERAPREKREPAERPARPRRDAQTVTCELCSGELRIEPKDLVRITGTESAMIVSERPAAMGRTLASYTCPMCDANLTFFADVRPLVLIGTNLFERKVHHSRCTECARPLRAPTEMDRANQPALDAPIDSACGLECERCDAICCFGCAESMSRNRVTDGLLLCPRCYRGPVTRLHEL